MKTNIKHLASAGAFAFFLAIAMGSMDDKKDYSDKEHVEQKESVPKSYKTVITFKGNGMKKSELFHLYGNDAKIIYKYKSESPSIGVFNVYVVKKGVDIMEQGGIPEVMTTLTKDQSESTIQKPEGDYYLNVNGVGTWEVEVQESK